MQYGKDYYMTGSWSESSCSVQSIAGGHPRTRVTVEWTGKMGKQRTGTMTCPCGATARVIEYASRARRR